MIILMAMGLGGSMVMHGEVKDSKYNFWHKLTSISIMLVILYYGGFWDNILILTNN